MSKDIIVVTPNGRRQKVHVTPDTTILQVLEDACQKHGFEATEYNLKHHNSILDPTTTIRFSNLPNKATLEMVETDRRRLETNVTVGLVLQDGERRTADFSPNTNLFDLITSMAPSEVKSLQNPTIMYMRQEVAGVHALREKTLRQLGLLGGRAILRLLNKAEEAVQANVSAVYSVPISGKPNEPSMSKQRESPPPKAKAESSGAETSAMNSSHVEDFIKPIDPLKLIKEVKHDIIMENKAKEESLNETKDNSMLMEVDESQSVSTALQPQSKTSELSQQHLERMLKIEEEVTFLGSQKAISYMLPEQMQDELNDLPDDFYELSIEEVRKLYRDLQQQRIELENTPLLSADKRESISKESLEQRMAKYKNVVVRVQFPDRIVLQGIFEPTHTIEDVQNFIRKYLKESTRLFHIFTTPFKEVLNPRKTLLEARFVPCVHMHFKWSNEEEPNSDRHYLKDEVYLKQTSSEAARLLASKYRAPSRKQIQGQTSGGSSSSQSQRSNVPSSSKSSKLPKWFKR